MKGVMGKMLRAELTRRRVTTIDTAAYEAWIGGHGIGSALYWDLVPDKAIGGFDPANVLTLMTSPLTGTLAPSAAARVELRGVGVQSCPVEWFTRSNLGGFPPVGVGEHLRARQGRHRDMVRFPEYQYETPLPDVWPQFMPGRENGRWTHVKVNGRRLDREKVEEWKTRYYRREGWDAATGWPTRKTLEGAGLGQVADALEKHGKLGRAA